ncbi:MAG: asparagine synthase (glutamine-hydrolyzing), partial [Gammaproteobacteria bacterium]|nr:asparagine synthase (glutamine-hydrolyzing) [Gammaproteobacteria bacterium]
TDALIHRGPDSEGFYNDQYVSFGHRRLSIIDPTGGSQPMYSEDGNYILVFNGEIYNYVEIKDELVACGYRFVSNSDTEVLLYAYIHWGRDFYARLNGVWAFALYDKRKKKVILSRDRVGEKPLYIMESCGGVYFASEQKALLAVGSTGGGINSDFVEIYLSIGFVPAPFTMYKSIEQLKPGSSLLIGPRSQRLDRYWEYGSAFDGRKITDAKYVQDKFSDLFHDSVKIRTRCDVDYGVFLSGGLDSISVCKAMTENSVESIAAYTIGFSDSGFDETLLAMQAAKECNIKHVCEQYRPDSLRDDIEKVLDTYDEPFGDTSALAVDRVSSLAAKDVKMVLTGDGGDELLAGYNIYQSEKLIRYLKKYPILAPLAKLGITLMPNFGFRSKLSENIDASKLDFVGRLVMKSSSNNQKIISSIVANVSKNSISYYDYLVGLFENYRVDEGLCRLAYYNNSFTLHNQMLRKVDRMSMRFSLEARSPLLDHRLVEFMSGVDVSVLMPYFKRKEVIKKHLSGKISSNILRGKKKGFGVPLNKSFESLRRIGIERELGGLLSGGMYQAEIVDSLLESRDYSLLWKYLLLCVWISRQ